MQGSQDGSTADDVAVEIDDSLPPLERFKTYLNSSLILHRLHVLREAGEIAGLIGYAATVQHIIPCIHPLTQEPEPVMRQALVEQLPMIATLVAPNPEGYKEVLLAVIVRALAQVMHDTNPQVRQSAAESMASVAGLLKRQDLEEHVMPTVRELAADENEEEFRVEACAIFRTLAAQLGPDLNVAFVNSHLSKLAADQSSFRVRKAVAANLSGLLQALGKELTAQVMAPIFIELTKDEIWGVRKACAESLVLFSEWLPDAQRSGIVLPIIDALANDSSRWVRSALYQNLGPLLCTFPTADLHPSLLALYTEMAAPPPDSSLDQVGAREAKFGDSDAVIYCAFSFPGVLQAVGRDRWDGELRETFFALIKDLQWKVRQTLAASLHEVARLIGTEKTEECLLSVFDLFLRDLDEVKVGVLRNFVHFLRVLSPPKRQSYLPVLQTINQTDLANWRFRRLIARQLGVMGSLFSSGDVLEYLAPLSISLCSDQVARVREAAAGAIGPICRALVEAGADKAPTDGGSSAFHQFLQKILAFATSSGYAERHTYALICLSMVLDGCFREEFLAPALRLSTDKVPNVRLALARFLALYTPSKGANGDFVAVVEKLLTDPDRDVRSCLVSRPLRPKPQRALNNPSISASLPNSTSAPQPPATVPAASSAADVLALSEVVAKLRVAVALSSSAAAPAGSSASGTSAAAPAATKPDAGEDESSKLSPPSADDDSAA